MPLRKAVSLLTRWRVRGFEIDAVGQLAPRALTDTGRREIRHIIASHDLVLTAVYCPLRKGLDVPEGQDARLEYLREAMTLSFELGARLIVLQAGQIPEKADDPRRQWLTDALLNLGKHGDRIGCRVALEMGLEGPAVLEEFIGKLEVGSVGLAYNPGNLLIHGHNPYAALRTLYRMIPYAYARDARVASARGAGQEVALGHGDIDWLQLLGVFQEVDYRGTMTIQREYSQDAQVELPRAIAFLQRFLN